MKLTMGRFKPGFGCAGLTVLPWLLVLAQCRGELDETAAAIEADEGEALPGLREALAEARASGGCVTTAAQCMARAPRSR